MFVLLNKCRHTTLGFFFNLRCVLSLKALSADNKKGFSIQQIFISARSFPFQCQTSDIFECVLFFCTAAVIFLCAAVAARREAFVWNYPVMICSTDGSIKQKQQTAALNLWCVLQLTGPPGGQHIQTRAVVCLQKKILSLKTTNTRVVPCRPDSLWLDVKSSDESQLWFWETILNKWERLLSISVFPGSFLRRRLHKMKHLIQRKSGGRQKKMFPGE